jgi:hypothetical protein
MPRSGIDAVVRSSANLRAIPASLRATRGMPSCRGPVATTSRWRPRRSRRGWTMSDGAYRLDIKISCSRIGHRASRTIRYVATSDNKIEVRLPC